MARKIGEGHAAAMARLGLRELRGALYPASNVGQQSEYGLYGTLTPGEVADSRSDAQSVRPEGYDHGQEKGSVLDDRLQRAEGREDQGRDDRSVEKE